MKSYEQKFDELCEEEFIPAHNSLRIAISELIKEADAEIANLTPKAKEKSSEPELGYVDCEIYVDECHDLCYEHEGGTQSLQDAMYDARFIGFVFADGSMSRVSPWRNEETGNIEIQGERATHVRFKREVAK